MEKAKRFVIIVAAGSGTRAGGSLPKQFCKIGRVPVIIHTLRALQEADSTLEIYVVMHPDYMEYFAKLIEKYPVSNPLRIVPGGKTRADSVMAGLQSICSTHHGDRTLLEESKVAVHDVARPILSRMLLERTFEGVHKGVGVVPVVPATNSMRRITEGNPDHLEYCSTQSVERKDFLEVQTPQVFCFEDLWNAYNAQTDYSCFTDDASVAESAGIKICVCKGDPENIKITYPLDFKIAGLIIKNRKAD